jgi:selenocysteine-specific elongation factor
MRKDIGKPRLYIDRVFTMSGMGTVVTGTLIDGSLKIGQEVEIAPEGIKTRIKNLQIYKKQVEAAGPGTRVAMNLIGVEKEKIKRGDVVINPGMAILTNFLDVKVTVLPDAPFSLKNGSDLLFMLGTSEILGRVTLLNADQFKPGQAGFTRIKLKEPVLARVGDHFILRLPSPPKTLGGGLVLDVFPSKLRRKDKDLVTFLTRRENLDLPELILTELKKVDFLTREELFQASIFSSKEIDSLVSLLGQKQELVIRKSLVIDRGKWERLLNQILERVKKEHADKPFTHGLRISDLSAKLQFKEKLISEGVEYLLSAGRLIQKENFLAQPEHRPQLAEKQSPLAQKILKKFEDNRLTPPTKSELLEENSDYQKILIYLLQQGKLVELKEGILYTKEDFEEIIQKIKKFISSNGPSTVSKIREHLNITRKYAVPILEKLDELGITRREGDRRVLGKEKR